MVFKCLFFSIVNRYLKGYTRLKLEKGENDMSEITQEQLAYFKEAVAVSPKADALRNAVTTNGILQAARDNRRAGELTPVFSVDLESSPVANQLQSGRCWMFAALNTMRHDMKALYGLPGDFELSQSYTFFWDKLEKANYFYNNIVATAEQPTTDREVAFLLQMPQQDGGQWDMMVGLIEKYGVVPQSAYPESQASSHSADFNRLYNAKLRKDAITLRRMVTEHATEEQIAQQVAQFGRENYHILSLTFGEPPVTFNFSYRDKDNNFHSDANISPKDFYAKYIGWDLSEYVSIINAPTADKPFNQTYGVKMLGSVVGGREVKHLNLDLATFKDLAVKQLLAGENVWFGVDMGPKLDRTAGLMDTKLYNEDDLFDVDFSMTKAERLEFGDSLMTHAMVLTGVDLVDGKPTKWKVENSWGDKNGHKGYFTMSDEWFDEFTYQVVIKKEHLPAELRDIYENTTPYELAPWDPMGALA